MTKKAMVSEQAIKKAKIANLKHRRVQKVEKTVPEQKLSNDEMKALWLRENSITTCKSSNDYVYHKIKGLGSSEGALL